MTTLISRARDAICTALATTNEETRTTVLRIFDELHVKLKAEEIEERKRLARIQEEQDREEIMDLWEWDQEVE